MTTAAKQMTGKGAFKIDAHPTTTGQPADGTSARTSGHYVTTARNVPIDLTKHYDYTNLVGGEIDEYSGI